MRLTAIPRPYMWVASPLLHNLLRSKSAVVPGVNTQESTLKYYVTILFVILLAGCATNVENGRNISIVIDQNAHTDNNRVGWLSYGLALVAWEDKEPNTNYFEREVYARTQAAQIWKELKQNGSATSDSDLDSLVLVNDAGFMKEYVSDFLSKPSWVLPLDLKLEEFSAWMTENLPNHKPVINTGINIVEK